MHACMLVACILFYKIFLQTETYSLFHSSCFEKNEITVINRIRCQSITTEKKQLTDINHSFTFNSKVSSIVDNYLFNKETAKIGLKRKRERENLPA